MCLLSLHLAEAVASVVGTGTGARKAAKRQPTSSPGGAQESGGGGGGGGHGGSESRLQALTSRRG